LCLLIWQGWTDIAKLVLDKPDLYVDYTSDKYANPLYSAVINNRADIVKYILKEKAPPAVFSIFTNFYGNTYLHFAIEYRAVDAAGVFIHNGSDLEKPNKDGLTPHDLVTYRIENPYYGWGEAFSKEYIAALKEIKTMIENEAVHE
jgi:ankyrin repeat protein